MAELAILYIASALEWVHQGAVFGFGYCIDGQIPSPQVLLEGNIRCAINRKTVVAAPLFALGASQGIFFPGAGVQKYRKVRAHLFESLGKHFLWCRADDHPVPVLDLKAQ